LIIALVATTVSAQSNLPACQGSDVSQWGNCFSTYTFTNGHKYVGEFRDGKFNGQGTFTWPDGEKYFGEYRDGKRTGQGAYTWPDGTKYVGEFIDGKRTGQGIQAFVDGKSSQEGIWENDKFVRAQRIPDLIAGRTPLTPPTVALVSGTASAQSILPPCSGSNAARWSNCFGTSTFSNGDQYVGEFRGGKFNGQGSYTAANGNKYVGEFKEGKHSNQGILTFADGSPSKEGIWENGRFLRAQRIPDHIAGRSSPAAPVAVLATPPVAQAPRQAEPPRSSLSLSASASHPDANGVVTLNITTNSDTASLRVNGDEVGGRADGRYSVQRFAQIGNNNFEVIATDRFGNTRRQTISVSRQAADNTVRFASLNPIAVRARPATNAVAIIIGIQDYSRVPKAEFANNDARVFYDYAVRGLGVRPENIKLLVDQEADQVEVLSAFKNWLPLKTRKGLTDVYVFYSGHGLPSDDGSNLYMLPHGVDRQFLNETAIKQSVLITALQAVSPRSVTMFMDACYSGQIRTGETLLASARPIAIQSKASSYPANFNVISASAPDQLASSSPDLKHGMFSYFLMKGMEGEADENKDGNITMAEMQSYLKENVGKKALSINRTQVPQITGDQSRVLVNR
jgi:hypothetical protein